MEPRISLITLGVNDLERSLRFYRDGLGLPATWGTDKSVIFFKTQGVCLALYSYDDLAKDVGPEFQIQRSKFTGITLAHTFAKRKKWIAFFNLPKLLAVRLKNRPKILFWVATLAIFLILMAIYGK